jgi:hypothetical protein
MQFERNCNFLNSSSMMEVHMGITRDSGLGLLIGWATSNMFFSPFLGWNRTNSTITEATTGLLYQPRIMMDDDEFGAIGAMLDGRNRSTRSKSVSVPRLPPQIPHDLNRARTLAAAMGSRQLSDWATARPCQKLVGRFLSLPASCVLFNLQNFRIFLEHF